MERKLGLTRGPNFFFFEKPRLDRKLGLTTASKIFGRGQGWTGKFAELLQPKASKTGAFRV